MIIKLNNSFTNSMSRFSCTQNLNLFQFTFNLNLKHWSSSSPSSFLIIPNESPIQLKPILTFEFDFFLLLIFTLLWFCFFLSSFRFLCWFFFVLFLIPKWFFFNSQLKLQIKFAQHWELQLLRLHWLFNPKSNRFTGTIFPFKLPNFYLLDSFFFAHNLTPLSWSFKLIILLSVHLFRTLTPMHLRKAKLMFFYVRYPSSNVLKTFFPDIKFNKNNTAQLVKWFSNFR